jgi:hypothetical protein
MDALVNGLGAFCLVSGDKDRSLKRWRFFLDSSRIRNDKTRLRDCFEQQIMCYRFTDLNARVLFDS